MDTPDQKDRGSRPSTGAKRQGEPSLTILPGGMDGAPPAPPTYAESPEELFRRYKETDDERPFEALYCRYERALYSYALYMFRDRGPEEQQAVAEDVMQNTWVIVGTRADLWTGGSFDAWLWRVHRNECLKQFRYRGIRIAEEVFERLVTSSAEQDAMARWYERIQAAVELDAELAELLDDAIAALSPALGSVLLLHLQGKRDDEIAEIIARSPGSVRVRLTRARQKLRRYFLEHHPNLVAKAVEHEDE